MNEDRIHPADERHFVRIVLALFGGEGVFVIDVVAGQVGANGIDRPGKLGPP